MPLEEAGEEEVTAGPGGVELAGREGAEEAEEVGLYHPVVPELLEAFTEAVDLLEALAEGRLASSEAKAVYFEKVESRVEKVATDTTEKAEKGTRKTGSRRRSKSSSRKK